MWSNSEKPVNSYLLLRSLEVENKSEEILFSKMAIREGPERLKTL
jgi:hypothetical protein